jgi:small subunit ribosomal protein S2
MIYTIKQFIKSGVHLGHYKWECDYRLSYFLLGIRNSIHIINLYYTLFILKKALYIAYNISLLNQKIFIVNNIDYNLKLNINKINKNYLWFINNKWTSGLLSNQKKIYSNNEDLFLKFYNLGYNSLLPSYVFASNIKNTGSCIFESIILNIPCSSLIDSNLGYYGIFYGIPSNDDNFVNIYLFIRLFLKMYLKALYDNINSLNIKKNINKKNYMLNNQIKLDFRFDGKLKFWSKYKPFARKKELKNKKWNTIWIKKMKFKNKFLLKWKKIKKKIILKRIEFLKKKNKKINNYINKNNKNNNYINKNNNYINKNNNYIKNNKNKS